MTSNKDDGEIVIECSPYADSETEVVKLGDSYKIKDMMDVSSKDDYSIQLGIQIVIIAFIAIIASFFAIYVLSNLANVGLSFGSSIKVMAASVSSPNKNTFFVMFSTFIVTMLVLGLLNNFNIIDLNYISRVSGDETYDFFRDPFNSPGSITIFSLIIIAAIIFIRRFYIYNKARQFENENL